MENQCYAKLYSTYTQMCTSLFHKNVLNDWLKKVAKHLRTRNSGFRAVCMVRLWQTKEIKLWKIWEFLVNFMSMKCNLSQNFSLDWLGISNCSIYNFLSLPQDESTAPAIWLAVKITDSSFITTVYEHWTVCKVNANKWHCGSNSYISFILTGKQIQSLGSISITSTHLNMWY